MATGTFSREPTPPPTAFDEAVERQLRATQTQVKLVDIVCNTLLLIVAALGFVMLVAWIDHWLFALGFWTRLLALLVLLGASGWWIAVRIVPLVLRRINPVYAAQTIERAEPSLKNSLINFLLLRNEREKVHAVVYQAIGQRAASDLSHVPAENIVDYSHVLKIGYVLTALLVVGAIYKIISPKDPFQSAARIVAPWADIDRPSRVTIEDVTPGDVTIFQGEHVAVSATIDGAREDDIHVLFSTIDGQFVDQREAMRLDEAGLRYTVSIPGDDYGAQTTFQYKIIAGDAETRWHNVEIVPVPHVLVTKVEYTPPAYTDSDPMSHARGDIAGLEGTRVTVYARANREIASATLEFDPLPADVTPEARAASHAASFPIRQIDGQNLETSFFLRRTADGESPWHRHYTIRFTTTDGNHNLNPIVHSIEVKPDVAPLVEILSPKESEVEVPLNRSLEIEVRAVDPDFFLRKMRLVAVSGGRDLLEVTLLDASPGHDGQVVKKFEFVPKNYDLAVGDEVQYWAVAEDNRHEVKTGGLEPDPNITPSTPNFRIRVGPPAAEPRGGAADEPEDSEEGDGAAESEPSSAGGESGNNGGESGDSGSEDQSNDGAESSESSGQSGGNSGGQSGDSSSEGDDSSENSGGAGGESSNSNGGDSQNGSAGDSDGANSSPTGGNQSGQTGGSQQGQPGGPRDEPLENDGSRDGDIFDAINEHRQQQEQGGDSGSQEGGNAEDLREQDLNSDSQAGGQNSEQQSNDNPAGSASDQDSNSGGGSEQNQDGQQNNAGNSGANSGDANQQNGNQQNQGGGGEQSSGGYAESQQPKDGSSGSQEQNGGSGSQQQSGNKQSGGSESQQNQGGAGDQQQDQNAGGSDSQGGQPQGGAKPEGEEQQGGGGGEQQPSGGGMGQNDKSGGGQESQGGGSPQSQAEDEQQQGKEKSGGGQQGGGQKQEDGGKSPGGSKKDSDSQGGSGGDRKGGGEQGGGQSSKQQGQDSAGSSSSGEQGDGTAQEQGAGQAGNRAGGDQIANSPTGQSGEQAGDGSNTGSASGGEQNQDQPQKGERATGDPSNSGSRAGGGSPEDASANPQDPRGNRISENPGDGRGTMPTGGGKPADNHPSDTPLPDIEPGSDKANLEYARKSTDLSLEYLKNQKDAPDSELLDKLGWTKEEMNTFIERWERMKRSADSAGETSTEARRLDDSLRSLGLRPPSNKFRTGSAEGNRLANQRDSATRSRPPKEYADQYRAFSKFVEPTNE